VRGNKEGDWFTYSHSVGFSLNLPSENGVFKLVDLVAPHPVGWISSGTPNKNREIHGTAIIYAESGCISFEVFYENGRMIGSEIR